jgi:integrase
MGASASRAKGNPRRHSLTSSDLLDLMPRQAIRDRQVVRKRDESMGSRTDLTGCSLHGLRKACCRKLAEARCTVNQIQAISGHKTLAEVERYTRDADRTRLAEEAISRTQSYPRGDRFYPQETKA